MNLASPIALPAVEIRHPLTQAVLYTHPAQTLSALDLVITDDTSRKLVTVRLAPGIPRPLTLWQGADYDAAGDYTQAQVDARVTALLGADPLAAILALFHHSASVP